MSLAKELLNVLKQERFFTELFLVPGTVPKKRADGGVVPVLDRVLKPEDTKTVLIYFRELAGKVGALQKREVFTFAYPNLGRVRVVYGTQRGAYYLTLLKVPFEVPPVEEFFKDPIKFEKFYKVAYNAKGSVFVVFGEDWFVNATFIFSIFQNLERDGGKVVLTLENPLAYLLKHGEGVSIQKELYVDNADFEDGLKDIPLIGPDYIYVFDVLNIYTLPLREIFRYLPPSANLFINLPMRSEILLKDFLREKVKITEHFLGIRITPAPLGLFDFQVVQL